MNKSHFCLRDKQRAILSLFKGWGLKPLVLLVFLALSFMVPLREARPDFGDEIKKWVGFGKWIGPEKKAETKPESNPSATKTLSYSPSGTIEDVQKKNSTSHKSPPVYSPLQNYYHCVSGCPGACNFQDTMTAIRDGSSLELTLPNGNNKGSVDPQGNISIKSENLSCTGNISEDRLRLDCTGKNLSCQEVIYKT